MKSPLYNLLQEYQDYYPSRLPPLKWIIMECAGYRPLCPMRCLSCSILASTLEGGLNFWTGSAKIRMTCTGLMVFMDLHNGHMGLHNGHMGLHNSHVGLHNSHVAQVRSATPLRRTCVVLRKGFTKKQKRL
jgi:hypothetical protein